MIFVTVGTHEQPFNRLIFIVAIIVQVFTVNYENAGIVSYLKYIVCLMGIVSSIYIMRRNHRNRVMGKDIKTLMMASARFSATFAVTPLAEK